MYWFGPQKIECWRLDGLNLKKKEMYSLVIMKTNVQNQGFGKAVLPLKTLGLRFIIYFINLQIFFSSFISSLLK